MSRLVRACLALLAFAGLARPSTAIADPLPLLHPLFTDHLVLQRDAPVPVWGWASAASRVTVRFAGQEASADAGASGRWTVRLAPMAASSEPRVMSVTIEGPGGARSLVVSDVLVGDVWLCSGQSNMEFPLEHAAGGAAAVAAAHAPGIRLFTTARTAAGRPLDSPDRGYSAWTPVTPEAARGFSAVGYYFGTHLHEALGVPIGLINTSWGGTPIESWTSAGALAAAGVSAALARDLATDTDAWERAHRDAWSALDDWFAAHDPGSASAAWADPRLDDRAWAVAAGPARRWRDMGLAERGGIVWYRRTVNVPAAWAGKDLVLSLGPIAVRDRTWFNGQVVGGTLMPWETRSYTVPGALVKAGANLVAVRVLADGEDGGFTGAPGDLSIAVEGEAPVSIAEGWRLAPGPDAAALGRVPYLVGLDPWVPASLFNGKIAPLVPFALKGFIWYQGEQNTADAAHYGALLDSLVADWRAAFGGGVLPFGIVQLANFGARAPEPWDSEWAELRDEQRKAAGRIPAAGLAVTIDIGEAADIHPKNKADVGRRLAGWALSTAYGRGGEWSGPLYRAAAIEGGRIRIEFDHAGGGLVARGGALAGFTIAGADGRFVPADARIDGRTVVVSSPSVPSPAAVRYAWDDDPEVSLFNAEGLPASPFRTDDWARRERRP
jgi:sialate O-acetylesterase